MTGRHAATPTRHAVTKPVACRVGAHRTGYPDTMKCDRCGHAPILWVQIRELADSLTEDTRRELARVQWDWFIIGSIIVGFAIYGLMRFTIDLIRILGAA